MGDHHTGNQGLKYHLIPILLPTLPYNESKWLILPLLIPVPKSTASIYRYQNC